MKKLISAFKKLDQISIIIESYQIGGQNEALDVSYSSRFIKIKFKDFLY